MIGKKTEPVRRPVAIRAHQRPLNPIRAAEVSRVRKSSPASAPRQRNYAMAKLGGLTADWFSMDLTADQAIHAGLRRMRNRARDLARNDDYTRRFISLACTNIVGPTGITFRARSRDWNQQQKKFVLDTAANGRIEEGLYAWAKAGVCTLDRRLSLTDVENQQVRGLVVDGEFLCRKVRGAPNAFGFALQPLDPELLDEQRNRAYRAPAAGLAEENEIRMGVELDRNGAPLAYHFIDGESSVTGYGTNRRGWNRIPAAEIVHVFIQEAPGQTRGVTWLAPVALRKKMLDGFMDAVVTGARVAACKMGYKIRDPNYEGTPPNENADGTPAAPQSFEAEPGMIEELEDGFIDFKAFDPGYPPANFEEFTKTIIHGIAAGLGVSYLALSGDLSGVSYSGGRLAMLGDQDVWRCLQNFLIEHFCDQFYPDWLLMVLTTQAVALPLSKKDKFLSCAWRPRGWKSQDPVKDAAAAIMHLKAGTKSFTEVCDDMGGDFNETLEELAENYALAESLGVALLLDLPQLNINTGDEPPPASPDK